MIDIEKLDIKKTHRHLIDGDFSAQELTKECLSVVKEKNKEINAYLEIFEPAEAFCLFIKILSLTPRGIPVSSV